MEGGMGRGRKSGEGGGERPHPTPRRIEDPAAEGRGWRIQGFEAQRPRGRGSRPEGRVLEAGGS
eukprot:408978-Pyramimonas_sp.AAC.1